jgi:tRNA 2-thiouridine synthesizing protein B
MAMLHIITASPVQSSALTECLSVAGTGDAVLLLGEGVYATAQAEGQLINRNVFVLQEHTDARGLPRTTWAQYIDYSRMVELTEQHHPIQTWF